MISGIRTLFVGLAALFGAAGPAAAHDFWIEPAFFRPAVGTTLVVRLRVGEDFPGDSVPRRPDRIERFALIDGRGERAVGGAAGEDPAGSVRIEDAGAQWIVYHGRRVPIELEAAKFEAYLREEGLDRVIARRAERGESRRPGREVYSRCAKSLIGGFEGDFERPLGLPLEIVPVGDPRRASAGWSVRVLHGGEPQAGVLVRAVRAGDPGVQQVRTGADGVAEFSDPGRGMWRVVAVLMIEAPPETKADWESLWASLTFEAPTSGAEGSTRR